MHTSHISLIVYSKIPHLSYLQARGEADKGENEVSEETEDLIGQEKDETTTDDESEDEKPIKGKRQRF